MTMIARATKKLDSFILQRPCLLRNDDTNAGNAGDQASGPFPPTTFGPESERNFSGPGASGSPMLSKGRSM